MEENIRLLKSGVLFMNQQQELFWWMGKQWVSPCKRVKSYSMDDTGWHPIHSIGWVVRGLMTLSGRYKPLS